VSATGSSVSCSEQSEFEWFLEHVLELLLECDNHDAAMAGMFDAMATCAFRRSFIPLLVARMKTATTNLEQRQKSSWTH
jgi:hypothetical protein